MCPEKASSSWRSVDLVVPIREAWRSVIVAAFSRSRGLRLVWRTSRWTNERTRGKELSTPGGFPRQKSSARVGSRCSGCRRHKTILWFHEVDTNGRSEVSGLSMYLFCFPFVEYLALHQFIREFVASSGQWSWILYWIGSSLLRGLERDWSRIFIRFLKEINKVHSGVWSVWKRRFIDQSILFLVMPVRIEKLYFILDTW